MKALIAELRIALMGTVCLAVLLCGAYPLSVWIVAQLLFPHEANGSLVTRKGIVIGSSILAQRFEDAKYFHTRPSAAGQGYDAANSGGSNAGPLSKRLVETVKGRVIDYRTENKLSTEAAVPADAVTASGSGLDPHISVKNAVLQAPRVAKARGISEQSVLESIKAHTAGRDVFVLGEPRVNVLELNLSLDNNRLAVNGRR
jgi:potassium-transporting ATPase KdpC subunit